MQSWYFRPYRLYDQNDSVALKVKDRKLFLLNVEELTKTRWNGILKWTNMDEETPRIYTEQVLQRVLGTVSSWKTPLTELSSKGVKMSYVRGWQKHKNTRRTIPRLRRSVDQPPGIWFDHCVLCFNLSGWINPEYLRKEDGWYNIALAVLNFRSNYIQLETSVHYE